MSEKLTGCMKLISSCNRDLRAAFAKGTDSLLGPTNVQVGNGKQDKSLVSLLPLTSVSLAILNFGSDSRSTLHIHMLIIQGVII
jgi:hypothetical protein